MDDQTFREQLLEIILKPHLVQVCHLHALTIAQHHVVQHERGEQRTTQGPNLQGPIEPA